MSAMKPKSGRLPTVTAEVVGRQGPQEELCVRHDVKVGDACRIGAEERLEQELQRSPCAEAVEQELKSRTNIKQTIIVIVTTMLCCVREWNKKGLKPRQPWPSRQLFS